MVPISATPSLAISCMIPYDFKTHISLNTASGDTPIKEYRRFAVLYVNHVTSRLFQKWCSRGVVSTFSSRKIIGISGFFETFLDIAVAHEHNFWHR